MSTNSIPKRIAEMAAITRMERGHLSVMRTTADGQAYHNIQRRENGRNVTEYVPLDQIDEVRGNIAAYERFKALCDEHIAEVSEASRRERKDPSKKKRRTAKPSASPGRRKSPN